MGPSIHFKMIRMLLLQNLVMLLTIHVHAAETTCTFPPSWSGDWFHSGVTRPVEITHNKISFKGKCLHSDRDRYLLEDRKFNCWRCLVIHQKHENVLQYKETFCDTVKSLDYVCAHLTGDSTLHSMFRIDGKPVQCPFPDTYTFTYNRGYGECAFPRSSVESCTEDWRIVFRYQACPDIQGTESYVDEVKCLAVWKEGSNRFLVGRRDNPRLTSYQDRYRCYVYEPWYNGTNMGFLVSPSGDATCHGLFSVSASSRLLKFIKVDSSESKCRFPVWIGGPHWHSLDGQVTLHVTRRNSTLRLTSRASTRPTTHACLETYDVTKRSATYITRVFTGCTNGYQCVHMVARDDHVLELRMGRVTPVQHEACKKNFFRSSSTNFTTFVSGNAESRKCPGIGRYKMTYNNNKDNNNNNNNNNNGDGGGGANVAASTAFDPAETTGIATSTSSGGGGFGGGGGSGEVAVVGRQCPGAPYTYLVVGCGTTDTLELVSACDSTEYSCHGAWEEAGRQYLVVTPTSRSSKGVRRLCLVLDHGDGVLSLASSPNSCSREMTPGLHGPLAFNTTSLGRCYVGEPASRSPALLPGSVLSLVLTVVTSLMMSRALYR